MTSCHCSGFMRIISVSLVMPVHRRRPMQTREGDHCTCIVHQDVDCPPCLHKQLHHFVYLFPVANICLHGDCRSARRLNDTRHFVRCFCRRHVIDSDLDRGTSNSVIPIDDTSPSPRRLQVRVQSPGQSREMRRLLSRPEESPLSDTGHRSSDGESRERPWMSVLAVSVCFEVVALISGNLRWVLNCFSRSKVG